VLGVPTVADRIAQTAAAMLLEEKLEPIFHPDSYGYRPGRSAHDALAVTRRRCWKQDWVLDLDVRAFFDSVPHDLLLKAVAHHTDERWVLLYIQRWLTAPMQMPDGTLIARDKGTPQGSPISPLLANVFMHYAFDTWMVREFPGCPFERYADDIVAHCDSEDQARALRDSIATRLGALGLELHPEKTKVVFCQDANRPGEAEHTSFDFLGYTFRGRLAKGRRGYFVSFAPAISVKAAKAVGQKVRAWHLNRRNGTDLSGLAEEIDPQVRGWNRLLRGLLPLRAVLPRKAHRRASRSMGHAEIQTTTRESCQGSGLAGRGSTAPAPALRPLASSPVHPRPARGSRMTGDCHVRFCESRGVRFPPATHQTP
jgi:RNA-directed DNA polymerase